MYFDRSDDAIAESKKKYGKLCLYIAQKVLCSAQDAEEAEMDAYFKAWNEIPPQRPKSLGSFLAVLARRSAIDILRRRTADKRGAEYVDSVDELEECIPSQGAGVDFADSIALRDSIERFLAGLCRRDRVVFMKRYWWSQSVIEISRETALSEGAVKMRLARLRQKLKEHLEMEGF